MKKHLYTLFVSLLLAAVSLISSLTAMAQDAAAPAETSGSPAGAEPTAEKTWVDTYDTLLQKYVTPKGVKYKAWHGSATDRATLRKVIAEISSKSLSGLSRDEKLAFYLNAYNAWILHRILQDYPTGGPGGGRFFGRNTFFKSDAIRVVGGKTSFNALENEVIRPKFKEARIHFALNCASRSCPPLHNLAFRAETLDATLDALTRAFVNSSRGVTTRGGSKVAVSKIFDWYEDDFKGGAVAYINRFRKSKIPSKAKVSYQNYSWKLNESN